MVVLPLGTAVLILYLNWIHTDKTQSTKLTIEDLRTWLFLSKFRHKVVDVFDGWTLDTDPYDRSFSFRTPLMIFSIFSPQNTIFGKHIERALFNNKPTSLSHIGNWLLALPHESLERPLEVLPTSFKLSEDLPFRDSVVSQSDVIIIHKLCLTDNLPIINSKNISFI